MNLVSIRDLEKLEEVYRRCELPRLLRAELPASTTLVSTGVNSPRTAGTQKNFSHLHLKLSQSQGVLEGYKARLDYLYRLYAQGVPVVVPSTTSIPTQPVPSTIPDPAFPSQSLQILVPSTSSI